VAPLHPDQVSGLDPEGGAEYVRAALARCAGYVSPDLARSGTDGLGRACPRPSRASPIASPAGRAVRRCRHTPAVDPRWGRPRRRPGRPRAAIGGPGRRGRGAAIASPRRTISFSVNARGQTSGSVTTACRTCTRAIPMTRLARTRSATVSWRLRCDPVSSPWAAMAQIASAGGRWPAPRMPAE
jgi:hypothetical protein